MFFIKQSGKFNECWNLFSKWADLMCEGCCPDPFSTKFEFHINSIFLEKIWILWGKQATLKKPFQNSTWEMWQLSLGKHQVLDEGSRNKFQRELEALKFSNVKIETLILELSDSRDDVQKVFNLVLMSLQLSHQILP